MAHKLARCEQETILRRAEDETHWDIFTDHPERLRKRGWAPDLTLDPTGKRFLIPKAAVTIRSRVAMERRAGRRPGFGSQVKP